MNIEDILKGAPRRRLKTVKIDGLPDLILTELTAAERWAMIGESPDVNADPTPGEPPDLRAATLYYAKWTLYSLLGCNRPPTDDEIREFTETYSYNVIDTLIKTLIQFNAIDRNAVQDAKKN